MSGETNEKEKSQFYKLYFTGCRNASDFPNDDLIPFLLALFEIQFDDGKEERKKKEEKKCVVKCRRRSTS